MKKVLMDEETVVEATSSSPRIEDPFAAESQMDKSGKDRLLELLDQVEVHVERFRKDASRLELERDTLVTTLDTIRNSDLLSTLDENDKDDINRYCERVSLRCLTVEVSVQTMRDHSQEEALHQVNRMIDGLVVTIGGDPSGSRVKCLSYMASCTSAPVDHALDKTFESAILGCTVDDQKRIRRRLQGLLDYMGHSKITVLRD